MTALFVSDVHLSAERPERVAAFERFLAGPAARAEVLYVLGDLFDLWLGDDDDREPHPRVVDALARLTASGTPVHVVLGNHDFLLGEDFAARTGCALIAESETVEVRGEPVLLMHGDTLCTRDEEYQAFRRYARDPENQRAFLAQPLDARLEQAGRIRRSSADATRLKPDDIMDVTPAAVAGAMRDAGVRHLVHGHTHRPAVHPPGEAGAPGTRIVLGDWYEGDSVLTWDAGGFRLGGLDFLGATGG